MTAAITHEDPTLSVHAYLDGELDLPHALAVERDMATDPALAAAHERMEALQRLMQHHLREAPPAGLRRRVEAAVALRHPDTRWRQSQFSWRALAASIAVTAVVASGSTSMLTATSQRDMVRDGIVDAHIRSLMAAQPIDVASSDRHTVKPWFNGRIPQAPRVVDLAKQDFPLVGGRIDVVGEVPVPTLVYHHAKHLVSLTATPASGRPNAAPVLNAIDGYNMYRWAEDGVTYWAVSDLAPADLDKFVELFRTTPPDQ
jgi:anti-sigma factor RsiW